jgi:hypothetical protein
VRATTLEVFDGWASVLTDMIRQGALLAVRPLYALPMGHRWTSRRGLTLVGDATHVMSPFAGEGVTLALADAADLADALTSGAGWAGHRSRRSSDRRARQGRRRGFGGRAEGCVFIRWGRASARALPGADCGMTSISNGPTRSDRGNLLPTEWHAPSEVPALRPNLPWLLRRSSLSPRLGSLRLFGACHQPLLRERPNNSVCGA